MPTLHRNHRKPAESSDHTGMRIPKMRSGSAESPLHVYVRFPNLWSRFCSLVEHGPKYLRYSKTDSHFDNLPHISSMEGPYMGVLGGHATMRKLPLEVCFSPFKHVTISCG